MEISSVENDPPIQRLGHDLLLHIFEQNAYMFTDDDALITTRTASEVCQNWRSLILATPLLWGRLLDFDALARHTGGGYWGDELVRRTGGSLLWIKAREFLAQDWPDRRLSVHFLKTVEENLHRIQILVMDVNGMEWMTHFALWNKIISLPAPQLESFELTVASKQMGLSHRIPETRSFRSPAFADEAPRLRKFKAVQFEFNLRAPWVSGLRDLYIGYPPLLPEFLDALANTESLERLEIHCRLRGSQEDVERLRPINLPKLKQLRLFCDPNDCMILLAFVKIPRECALQCVIFRRHRITLDNWDAPDVTEELFTRLIPGLASYARKYFQHQTPTDLMFYYQPTVLCITSCPDGGLGGIHVQIERDQVDFSEQIKTAFFSEFTLPEFLKVTDLRLQIMDFDRLSSTGSLLSFLGCLLAVQILHVNDRNINFFEALKEKLASPRSILPSLKTIRVQPNRWPSSGSTEEEEKLATSKFVDALNKGGYPVEVVCSQ